MSNPAMVVVARSSTTIRRKQVTKTTTYTVLSTDEVIRCNHASTPFTITLRAAVGARRELVIKNIGAAAVTVQRAGSDTIDGSTSIVLAQWGVARLFDAAAGAWDNHA